MIEAPLWKLLFTSFRYLRQSSAYDEQSIGYWAVGRLVASNDLDLYGYSSVLKSLQVEHGNKPSNPYSLTCQ